MSNFSIQTPALHTRVIRSNFRRGSEMTENWKKCWFTFKLHFWKGSLSLVSCPILPFLRNKEWTRLWKKKTEQMTPNESIIFFLRYWYINCLYCTKKKPPALKKAIFLLRSKQKFPHRCKRMSEMLSQICEIPMSKSYD